MDCVVCKKPLVALELNEVEIDHCLASGGIWLDAGELESLLEYADANGGILDRTNIIAECGTSNRRCPICGKKMKKYRAGNANLELDTCPIGDGIWFDRGELEQVVELFAAEGNEKLAKVLSDFFGEKRNR